MSEIQRRYSAARIRTTTKSVENDEYLIHYGIRGQKWGLRRFQNEDRTLTEEGKERYNKASREERKAQKKAEKQAKKEAKEASKPESATWKSKEARYLDDAELNRRNSRLQREQQYRQLTESRASKFINSFKKNAGKIFVASLVGAAAGYMGKNYKSWLDAGSNFISNSKWLNVDLSNLR